mmetsp:Transcript_18494/g.21243  ORF Transcript_18494/g.21243 Transcript_18494/m.21243 type:complete len:134 (-) Transcript_18494:37-438(-)
MKKELIVYCRRFMRNLLFNRNQMCIEILHPNHRNPTRKGIREKLAKVYKKDENCVSVYGLRTVFGGGKTTGFACIYDDFDSRQKYDQKHQMARDGVEEKKKKTRKAKKELKTRVNKVRGTEKDKVRKAGAGKK